MNYTCSGCDASWSSLSWAHCSVCHSTFTGVTYFDQHRHSGVCTLPETLVEQDGVYSTPKGHLSRSMATERMAAARAARGTASKS